MIKNILNTILFILFILLLFCLTWPAIILGYIFDSSVTFNRNDYEDSEFVYKVKRQAQNDN
jgi:hypothetical protein